MKTRLKWTTGLAILAVAVLMSWVPFSQFSKEVDASSGSPGSSWNKQIAEIRQLPRVRVDRKRDTSIADDTYLNPTVEELKMRWLKLRRIDPSIGFTDEDIAEREELAYQCVRSLGFSPEMFELQDFLSEKEILVERTNAGVLPFALRLLEKEPELREFFAETFLKTVKGAFASASSPKKAGDLSDSVVGPNYVGFANSLGRGMNDEAFDSFLKELESLHPDIAVGASIGRAEEILESDPGQYLSLISHNFEYQSELYGESGLNGRQLLSLVAKGKSAEDFKEAYNVLNHYSTNLWAGDLSALKADVISRLAGFDPDESIRLFIGDSEIEESSRDNVMREIGSSGFDSVMLAYGQEEALGWLSSIPDEEFRTIAIRGAAIAKAASYIEGSRDENAAEGLKVARKIANLIPETDRIKVFGNRSWLGD